MSKPNRGEIWWVEFDPTRGDEISKTRPAVVVSLDSIGKLPLRIIVPITDWKSRYDQFPWFVKINPNRQNGLSKASGADTFQVKSLSMNRFKSKIGMASEPIMNDISEAIGLCIGI